MQKNKKIAVVHDWIFCRRGGEKVLERILNLYPQSDLYFLFGDPKKHLKNIGSNHKLFPSFLSAVPFIEKIYKLFLPLFPVAIESFDLSSYDLVISTSSCVAKGVIPSPNATHICYIHSPMRYAWDQEHRYFPKKPSLLRPLELLRRVFLSRLRVWDVASSCRVDVLVANSHFVARRCALYYGKQATVVYPPVETSRFEKVMQAKWVSFEKAQNNKRKILLFGAWVPYKKMYDTLALLVENHFSVIAAGHGEQLTKASRDFSGKATFFVSPDDNQVLDIYEQAHVLLFPAIEDFGIVPLEATASGLWVVAPDQGGTKETVVDQVTGFHFQEGNKDSMLQAVQHALQQNLSPKNFTDMKNHVQNFSSDRFDQNWNDLFLKEIL